MTEWDLRLDEGLAFFFIFMTAVLNCLPDQKYRKYVRFFLGMLLLILMTGPLLELFRLDERLSRDRRTESFGGGSGKHGKCLSDGRGCRRNICIRDIRRR